MNDKEKELIISQAFDTDEGRAALFASMLAPIQRSINYSALGSKLLSVQTMPQGALCCYGMKRETVRVLADLFGIRK